MRFSRAGTMLALTTSVFAQNTNTNDSSNPCGNPSHSIDGPVNASSGSASVVRSGQNWSLTVTLKDVRTPTTANHSIWGWLSTPQNATENVCVHVLSVLLEPQLNGQGGCAGSLSERCTSFLESSIQLTAANIAAKNCPNVPSLQSLIRECGDPLGKGFMAASAGPIDLSNNTCTEARVPGINQPPEQYSTRGLFGLILSGADRSDAADPSQFTWYDRYVTQPMPWIVAEESNGQSRTRVVCVQPKYVSEGSRIPEKKNAAGRVVQSGWVGVVVAVVAMALL